MPSLDSPVFGDNKRYKPTAWYLPLLSVTFILALLFVLGVEQQKQLREAHLEQLFKSLSNIETNVATNINRNLQHTAQSAERFATTLSSSLSQQAPPESNALLHEFDQRIERRVDGSWRNRQPFDGREQAALVIPDFVTVAEEQKAIFSELQRVTEHYGRGARQAIFVNSWVLPAIGGEAIYWPDMAGWIETPTPDFDYRQTEWVQLVTPDNNPDGAVRWTPMAFDPIPKVWMMSAVAPLWRNGEWFGSAGHDVPLDKLIESTQELRHSVDAEFLLVTGDGLLLASDRYANHIIASEGKMTIADIVDPKWQTLWQTSQTMWKAADSNPHIRFSDDTHQIFASRIQSQHWYLLHRVPTAPIAAPIEETFAHLRNITVAAFVVEMIITIGLLWWNYRRTREFLISEAQAKQILAVSEKRFRDLVANVPGIVYRCANDEHWTMFYVSGEVEKITGYMPDDFINNRKRSFTSVIHPDDRQRVAVEVDSALAKRQPWSVEYRVQHALGHFTWVHEKGMGVFDDQDDLLYLDGVIVDVNQQKQDEQALKQINEELESRVQARTAALQASNAELEAFSYSVSHDLRAPLRHIMGYVQILRDELREKALEHRDTLDRISKAGVRMQALIGGLLALSHVGRNAMQFSQVDLNELIDNVIPELNQSNIDWRIDRLGRVEADERLIHQVFANLLSNAIKYSGKQTTINIRIQRHDDIAQAGELVFSVRDNGVGFAPEQKHRLFKMFHRLHGAKEFSGEGIGLAITQKIIHLHQGRIWAESTPGQGAQFFVALPLRQNHQKTPKISNTDAPNAA